MLAIPTLVILAASSAWAEGPSTSAQQSMTVSVEVVRPCAIDSSGGSAHVTCGTPASQMAPQPDAPKPLVTESAQGADSGVTVQF